MTYPREERPESEAEGRESGAAGPRIGEHPYEIVCAVAEGPLLRVFAAANEQCPRVQAMPEQGLEAVVDLLMRIVAPRLRVGLTTGAPPVFLRRLHLDQIRVCLRPLRVIGFVRPPIPPRHDLDWFLGGADTRLVLATRLLY